MLDLSKYKLFIFDLDNTLIASESQHTQAFQKAMKTLAGYTLTEEDIHDYIGNTSGWLARKIIDKMGFKNITPEMISQKKAEFVMENFETKPYPGVLDFLNYAFSKVEMSVASNSPSDFVRFALKEMGALNFMKTVLTVENVKKRKPDPEMLLKLAEMNKLTPGECLVFEDSALGLQAAANGGFPVVLLVNPGNLLPDVIPDDMPTMTWPQLVKLAKDALPC